MAQRYHKLPHEILAAPAWLARHVALSEMGG